MELSPDLLLHGYRNGFFPMADPDEDNAIYWYAPDPRAVIPLDRLHVSKNLARLVRQERFEVIADRDFEGVMRACAAREKTWISEEIIAAYTALHRAGYAHRETDASKVALVHLVERLRRGGFTLLDTQFNTPHLARFGVVEIPRAEYERRLTAALQVRAWWPATDPA